MNRIFLILLLLPLPAFTAEKLSVAAAANLLYVIDSLNAEFKKAEPQILLTVNFGASGSLVAQIEHGAPFDVFLSADTDYPRQLVARGKADAASYSTFATGRLVLWTTKSNLRLTSLAEVLRNPAIRTIAISNPELAPYGRGAVAVLENLGVWNAAKPKLVLGENITHTAQFVDTGNADLGFVALSLVLAPRLKGRGQWLLVPLNLHEPLDHAGVLTKRGQGNAAARRYLVFLRSPRARAVFERFGYGPPSQ